MSDLVSIILPVYNCEDYIGETINSILKQSYINWELIIIDDKSEDNSIEMIKKILKDDLRVRYLYNEINKGVAYSRDIAIQKSKGKYIAFIDSDDIWKNDKLTKQIYFMKVNKFNFTATSYEQIDEKSVPIGNIIKIKKENTYEDVLFNSPGNSTIIFNKDEIGYIPIPQIKKRNDYLYWLTLLKKEKKLYGLNEILSYYRVRGNSLSSNKIELIKYHWIIYREYENFNAVKSLYILIKVIIISLFKNKFYNYKKRR